MSAVLVLALEGLGLGVWQGNAVNGGEGDAIELVGEEEHAVAHVLQLQIGTDQILVEAELGLLGTVGIVAPVPALGLEVLAVLLDFGLDVGQFGLGLADGGFPHLVQQTVNGLGGLCHAGLQRHGGEVVITHQTGLLQTGGHQLCADVGVVVLVAVVSAVDVAVENLLAQVAVVGILEEGHDAGVVQGEDPLAGHAVGLGGLGGCGDEVLGQSGQVFLLVNDQAEGVGLLEHVLSEGELEHGDAAVQLAQLGLTGRVEVGTAAHEVLVGLFQELLLLLVQLFLVLVLIDLLDALEQGGVQADVVAVLGEQGREFLAERLQLVVGVGAVESVEDHADLGKQGAALVQGSHGVLEGGGVGIGDDVLNLGHLLFHSGHEGGFVMLGLDALEGGHTEGGLIFGEEGVALGTILVGRCGTGGKRRHCTGCKQNTFHKCIYYIMLGIFTAQKYKLYH